MNSKPQDDNNDPIASAPARSTRADERRHRATVHRAAQLLANHGLAEAVATLVIEQAAAGDDLPRMVRARDIGITPRVWRNLIKNGKLTGHRIGRELLVRRDEFESYLLSVETSNERRASTSDDIKAFAERCRA